jgi:hypothetical protein
LPTCAPTRKAIPSNPPARECRIVSSHLSQGEHLAFHAAANTEPGPYYGLNCDSRKPSSMNLYQIDPIADGRWSRLVQTHPRASVFHTADWLKTLRRTYGYQPVAFTTSPPTSDLENGLLFCRVSSWLTGRRLVSLPFSDHCEPLCDSVDELNFLIRYLQASLSHGEWNRLEFRPVSNYFRDAGEGTGLVPAATHYFHSLDLRPGIDELFAGLNKDSVQRRVRRAERAGLIEKCGNSVDLLRAFYPLFVTTRSRHHLPPIPFSWFRNLIESQGQTLQIRVAYREEVPIAAILTLRFRDVAYYKYGGSHAELNKFGAMPWLLWSSVRAAKASGATSLDMGRTEDDNPGLLAFKNHWVPNPQLLTYWRFPDGVSLGSSADWKLKTAKRIFSCMPDRLLSITGKLIYRHIG